MPKSKKNHRRKPRKTRKSRKNRTRRNYPSFKRGLSGVKARGPSPDSNNVPCCMCEHQFRRNTMFTPLACLNKNQDKAHKICKDCWWDPETGFARENAPHGCPGCKKGLPLNPPIKKQITDEIIVISD